jgi:four helix bundle protein
MSSLKSFDEIIAWQKARELTKTIYIISGDSLFEKDYALKDQIRRSSVSIMANIAEGFDRRGDKEFIRFLNIAKGSLAEVKSHLFVALDVKYITKQTFDSLFLLADEIGRLISGLINYLKPKLKNKVVQD